MIYHGQAFGRKVNDMYDGLVFHQVDVFAGKPFRGNPLAVVSGADMLSVMQMAEIANWTNLSETVFLLEPSRPDADYRVRIFTPSTELPFAGHPTLGAAYVWRLLHGVSERTMVVQECGAGLVKVRDRDDILAFAAPPRRRSGAVDAALVSSVSIALNLSPDVLLDAEWGVNGPEWLMLLLRSADDVVAVQPDYKSLAGQKLGIIGACAPSDEARFELRAFAAGYEDPVTGSLNAAAAQWLIGAGYAPARYLARQGTVLGRAGHILIEKEDDDIWVGGMVDLRISGKIII